MEMWWKCLPGLGRGIFTSLPQLSFCLFPSCFTSGFHFHSSTCFSSGFVSSSSSRVRWRGPRSAGPQCCWGVKRRGRTCRAPCWWGWEEEEDRRRRRTRTQMTRGWSLLSGQDYTNDRTAFIELLLKKTQFPWSMKCPFFIKCGLK